MQTAPFSPAEGYALPRVECHGSPRELGQAQGEALRSRIEAFVAQRVTALQAYLSERGASHRFAEFLSLGRACREAARAFHPDGIEEHDAIAEAAHVDASLLYAATNMTDVRDVLVLPAASDREGCTTVLVPPDGSRQHVLMAGQTWDLNPTDLDFVVAVHRRPDNGPQTWSITCTGALSLMGMNAEGVAVGTTNIKTRASRIGAGYLTLLHRAIGSRSMPEAIAAIRAAPRAAAHTYWVADAQGASELECDPEAVIERQLANQAVVQTNHCQSELLRAREGELPSSSSQRRLLRAQRVLASGGHDVATLQALFADRSDGLDSINRYPEDAQGTTTNACMVCIPAKLELWACRGPADRGIWQQLELT